MRRFFLIFLIPFFTLTVNAYNPQYLPIDYEAFFDPFAINSNSTDLVKDIYPNTTSATILRNQWATYSQTNYVSPTVENSSLSYSNYIDNNAGKAIVTIPNRFYNTYSLTAGTEYTGRAFYLSVLINFSAVRDNDAFIFFSRDYYGVYNRWKLIAQNVSGGYKLGIQFNTETAVFGAATLGLNQTYLVVLKITPASTGTEAMALFINPVIDSSEPSAPTAYTSVSAAALTRIGGLTIRATATGKFAGLRFSDKWSDVVCSTANVKLPGTKTLEDIELIKSRFTAAYLPDARTSAINYSNTIDTSGKWSDINYVDSNVSSWDTGTHLQRLIEMSAAYQTKGNLCYQKPEVLQSIIRGLNYYCNNAHTSQSPSWFDACIGQQLRLQEILMLMQDFISGALLKKGCMFLSTIRPSFSIAGQNVVWIMGQKLHRGILLKDSADIQQALDTIQMEIALIKYTGRNQVSSSTDKVDEGIQEDYSYFLHGSQIYNGGYGRSFIIDQASYADKVRGTGFAYNNYKLKILSDLMLKGTGTMVRRSFFDPSVTGRYISRSGNCFSSMLGTSIFDQMSNLLPDQAINFQDLKNHIAGKGNPYSFIGNNYFWNADYINHQRKKYYASVRTTSNRTIGTETLNGENLLGYWLPFGTNFITRNGSEYANIFPVWNWAHLPGVTCPEVVPSFETEVNSRQSESFVGGVSDGKYGMVQMKMNKLNTTARKAWFFFDNEIVALGNGISSTQAEVVNTNLNQCFLKGNVVVDNVVLSESRVFDFTNPKWVLHDSIGYIFLQAATVKLSNISQSGSWSKIGTGSSTTINANIFSLWINHGAQPTNVSYQYIVVPGVSQSDISAYSSNIPVNILSNTASVQAVRHDSANVMQAAFYAAGNVLIPNYTIDVNQPCLLMTRISSDTMYVSASNPVWSTMTLTVKVTDAQKTYNLNFTFAKGSDGGKTQTKFLIVESKTPVDSYLQVKNDIKIIGKTIQVSETGAIQVFNLQGIKVAEKKETNSLETNLSAGLYIIRFSNKNGKISKKEFIF